MVTLWLVVQAYPLQIMMVAGLNWTLGYWTGRAMMKKLMRRRLDLMMGKGDLTRPMNKEAFDAGYKRVFGERTLKRWEDAPEYTDGDRLSGESPPEIKQGTGEPSGSETDTTLESEEQDS